MLNHWVALVLVFKGTSILFSIVAVRVYIPMNRVGGFPFLHTFPRIYCLENFGDGHSGWHGGDTSLQF